MTDKPIQPSGPPVTDVDFTQDLIENQAFSLLNLFLANIEKHGLVLRGKTFRNCLIEGPAVIMPLENCNFDACDFGYAAGDINNLLLQPVGSKVTGAMVFADTKFERCTFFAVGFTGPPQLLEEFRAIPPRPAR